MAQIINADSSLTIYLKPTFARFIGSIFLFVGIFVSLKQYTPFHLYCTDKSQGIAKHCKIYQPGFSWIFPAQQYNEISKAKVLRMSGGNAFRARLYADGGKYTISSFSINERKVIAHAVHHINQYIKNSETNLLVIPKMTTWKSQIIFWFFIPFSIYFLSLLQNRKLEIDKETGTFILSKVLLWNRTEEIAKYDLMEIDKFELQVSTGRTGQQYSIILRLKNGEHIDIESASTNIPSHRQRIIQSLNDFLP